LAEDFSQFRVVRRWLVVQNPGFVAVDTAMLNNRTVGVDVHVTVAQRYSARVKRTYPHRIEGEAVFICKVVTANLSHV
jgi:hypothetical protein